MKPTNCPICGAVRESVFSAEILEKYNVEYWNCPQCRLLQTQDPFWLEEAHSDAVSVADTGIMSRNIQIARHLSSLLYLLDSGKGSYLDIAGGYGILVRLMRDAGFDYYWHDKYCENYLAGGFEGEVDKHYSAFSAIEVLEHVICPRQFLSDYLTRTGADLFCLTTTLRPENELPPLDWWYYSRETGQHVSFYAKITFDVLAKQMGMSYVQFGVLHIFLKNPELKKRFLFLGRKLFRLFLYFQSRRHISSLTVQDRNRIVKSAGDSNE